MSAEAALPAATDDTTHQDDSPASTDRQDMSWREVKQQRWEDRWPEYSAGYGIEAGELGPDADGYLLHGHVPLGHR